MQNRKAARTTLTVRMRPGSPTQAIAQFGPLVFSAALGRSGRSAFKREGDGASPRGALGILAGYRKAALRSAITSGIALSRVTARDGWCDAPSHPAYNRRVRLPFSSSHETLTRTDHLYDIVLVLDWNVTSRRRGAGSAIFLHLARPGYSPTEGCVALGRRDMLRLLPFLRAGTVVRIV